MEKVFLSDSGPKVSKAGYSLWRWEEMTDFDENEAKEIFSMCLQKGITTFEFSASSKNDRIHKVFFDTVAENNYDRKDLVIFAKLGKEIAADGTVMVNQSRQIILQELENFLKKTQKEYLDLLLLDGFDYITDIEEIAGTLDYLVYSGIIKHIGVADVSTSQYRLLRSILRQPIVTYHLEFNLLNPQAIFDGRLDEIKASFTRPLVWAPLAGGDILEGTTLDKVILRETLLEIATEHNSNVEQVAVAWLLNLGMLPIIGSPKKERILNVLGATEVKLTHEQWYRLFNLIRKQRK